jgi:hypothetical protein
MSWNIGIIKNEVDVTQECVEELQSWLQDTLGECDDLYYDGKINFNEDWHESMDFLFYEEAQAILRKHAVTGDICFGSLEGDNAGQFWGYRFDGKNPVINLEGTLSFNPKK